MDPVQQRFQNELIAKLQFKSSSRVGIENTLLKIFKFFDLDNSGYLKKQDFLKALAKAGVVLSDEQQSDYLFNIYSQDQTFVNYKDFIDIVIGSSNREKSPAQSLQGNGNGKAKFIQPGYGQSIDYPEQQESPPRNYEKSRVISTAHQNRTPIKYEAFDDNKSQTSKAASQRQQDFYGQNHQSPSQQDSQSIRSQTSTNRMREVELIVQRIKNRVATRGAKGFISLYRSFKMLDLDKDGFLTLSEFRKALRDHRIDVTDSEIDLVFTYFDRDRTGLVDLWGMMFVLKGELNPQRLTLVETIFQKIDSDNDQVVTLGQIKQAYSSRNHPDVKSGKKQDDEVIQDFIDSIMMLHTINGGFGNEQIMKEEFLEFFTNFSAAIPDDKFFETILFQVFKLGNEGGLHTYYAGGKKTFEPDHKKGYLQDHHRQQVIGGSVSQNAPFGTFNEGQQPLPTNQLQSTSFNIFKPLDGKQKDKKQRSSPETQQNYQEPIRDNLTNLRNKLVQRGIRGFITFQKKCRLFDRQNTGLLTYQKLTKVCSDLRVGLTEKEIVDIYKEFEDKDKDQASYDRLIKGLQGTMSQNKFMVVQQTFDSFIKDRNQQIRFDDIITSFNARNHVDVRTNKRKEEEVLSEFLDTFEENHKLYVQQYFKYYKNKKLGEDYLSNPNISFEEFICYYNNQNAILSDDISFEVALQGVFPQKSQRRF